MDLRTILQTLAGEKGPSGFEEPVAKTARTLLAPYVDETYFDRLGSLIGVRRCGRENAPKLLLDAHLDEIGLMVTGIEEGFLRFTEIGGVDPRMLPDREVTVLAAEPLFGVVACLPPHVQTKEDYDKAMPADELYIDVGLTQEEAERRIPIGAPITYRCGCFPLGEKRVCGKSMDDRACFTALLRCAELLKDEKLDVDLYLMGSTREEVNGAGALCGAFAIGPEACVAVDVTHGETPDVRNPKDRVTTLGGGPAIGLGPNCAKRLTGRLREKAAELGMDVQLEVMTGHTGTNAWGVQVAREGIATAVVSLPLRYMHTPVEVLDLSDLEGTARLLAAFVKDYGKEAAV